MELLAPAGNLNCFNAAVVNGADAVYLGLDCFNARMKADNFNVDNIRDVIRRAHLFGVKVYITVNTIVENGNFKRLLLMVKRAVEAKADAFIVQDLGVAAALRDAFCGIELHASTQLGIHNVYGAKVAERAGFRRVVLSRETTLEDIREIRRETSLELEYFVHGALCVSFSGNCYLSAVEQGASGNMGLCKQMCRLKYVAEQGGNKVGEGYLLSAKDVCLANSVCQLRDAGVDSLKIEGRMRREEYVAEAVSAYRRALDAVERDGAAQLDDNERARLKTAFCRGEFSERGYLYGDIPKIIEKQYNNHTGVRVGEVVGAYPFKKGLWQVVIKTDRELNVGDGLKFFFGGEEVASLGIGDPTPVGKGKIGFVTSKTVPVGAEVRLISDAKRGAQLSERKRYIDVDMTVSAIAGQPLIITAQCVATADGYTQEFASACWTDEPLESAKTAPLSEAELRAQASKTAETGFRVRKCDVVTDGVFVAKSVLNRVRRSVLNDLSEKLISARETHEVDINQTALDYALNKEFCGVAEPVCQLKIVRDGDEKLSIEHTAVIAPEKYDAQTIQMLISAAGKTQDDVMLLLPNVATSREVEKLEAVLSCLPELKTLVSENIYGLYFAQNGYSVIAGSGHNIVNDFAAREVESLGARGVVAGREFKRGLSSDVADLFDLDDDLPLMTFAHCPYQTVYGGDCKTCRYKAGLRYVRGDKVYNIKRYIINRCYFGLWQHK